MMLNRIGYVLLEIPSNLVLKRLRPSHWLGFITICWGILASCMAANSSAASILIIRFLLGAAEAGFVPEVLYFLTYWYRPTEIAIRMAIFFSAITLAGALGGILAFAIGHMEGVGDLAAWRWLFLLEGIPTPRTKSNITAVVAVFLNYRCYLHSLIGICSVIPSYSTQFLLSTVIKELGFDNLTAQLLTVPPYVCGAIFMIAVAYHSDRVNERGIHLSLVAWLGALGFLLVTIITHRVAKYLMLFLVVSGANGFVALNTAWLSGNVPDKTQRAVAMAFVISVDNIVLVLSQAFNPPDSTLVEQAIFLPGSF
ncbi:major facilitator superfamily domain-containing protein [Dimargaris cristalligena]|uniref:Major facilitator superfamily domain-containing protein n=1 Tax=Dimargaris cristalligena TaxID=215637 RepID=A0A4P9ZSJ5_9FUNG|nr:major facilitator superfamily domain-containing protein [Dimargaris cristalligena]|eukprot:RKP36407.1 major facilitator superfamily domain-containing protein [Dimargaris cristalligena]